MQIVFEWVWILNTYFLGKQEKYFKMSSAEIITQHAEH